MTSALSTIHLLPCTIQHNGVANVNEYFLTSHIGELPLRWLSNIDAPRQATTRNADQAGSNILEATLRGRQLYGKLSDHTRILGWSHSGEEYGLGKQ